MTVPVTTSYPADPKNAKIDELENHIKLGCFLLRKREGPANAIQTFENCNFLILCKSRVCCAYYRNFACSDLAAIRIGISESASFHSARKSL
jgi:hypothetical protein